MIGLWIGKTANANAWYHINPYAMARNSMLLHVVRYREAQRNIKDIRYHLFPATGTILDIIPFFIKGFIVLLRNKIDYVVTYNLVPWGAFAWVLAKIFRKPLVLGFIGNDFNYHLKQSLFRGILFYITKNTEIITVTGSNMVEYLTSKGVLPERIFIYPHCPPQQWLHNNSKEAKTYDLITVCALNKGKRVQDIIDALAILHHKKVKLSLCIVGDGPEETFLKKRVEEAGLQDFVHFAGYQTNVSEYLRKARIYVQASAREGLSLGLIEAMFMGLVPVTTNAGSEHDHIENGVNGYFVTIGDPEDLASKILVAQDEPNYQRLQQNMLKRRMLFSEEHAISVTEEIINRLEIKRIDYL